MDYWLVRAGLVVQGAKALTVSNRRTVGRWVPRESEVSLRSWGVGEQERSLTGDATAMRCADTFNPAAICNADLVRLGVMDVAAARGMQRESAASPLPRCR